MLFNGSWKFTGNSQAKSEDLVKKLAHFIFGVVGQKTSLKIFQHIVIPSLREH